ncbi:hypothetical protein ABZ806_30440 [Spirillospora sp. NPDC047418]
MHNTQITGKKGPRGVLDDLRLYTNLLLAAFGLGVIGFLGLPAADAAGHPPAGNDLVATSRTAGQAAGGAMGFTADNGSAARAPDSVTVVDVVFAFPPCWGDDYWCRTPSFVTRDSHAGGVLHWDPEGGRIMICDIEKDDYAVDGKIFAGSIGVTYVYVSKVGNCNVGAIPNYDKNKTYKFKVCLIAEHGEGFCNNSTSAKFPQVYCEQKSGKDSPDCGAPEGNACKQLLEPFQEECSKDDEDLPAVEPCVGLTAAVTKQCFADTKDQVERGGAWQPGIGPPAGDMHSPSIHDRVFLSHDNASEAAGPAEPINLFAVWLRWTVLGGCEVAVVVVGANAAIKHKRSEAGAHATGLTWVVIATVVAGSGLVFGLISIVATPL